MIRTLLISISVLLCVQDVYSQDRTFIREYTYTAGETDSKVTARQKALNQVKSLLVEELGTYIETWANYDVEEDQKINNSFFKQEIRTISAGITETQILDERWNGYEFYIKAEMNADPNEVVRRINQTLSKRKSSAVIDSLRLLLNNSAEEIELRSEELEKIRNQLSERKKQVEEKESEINSLEQELVRAKRNLDRFRAEEKRIETELESIRRNIESSTNKAVNNILIGMTPSEVIKVAGRPRVIDDCGSDEYYNYGKVWAIFESGIVSIMVSSRVFTRCRSANRYKSKGNGIIKY